MTRKSHIARFLKREDGSLLVFFSVSVIVILGIIALSFDLGRRASTQTDMQGYVDNVVLAAAGELDGSPNAIANANAAANTVIAAANERLKAGTAGQDFTIALDQIVYYENLPAIDTPASFESAALSASKYQLPAGTTTNSADARYVGVRLATVDVPWIFAGIFSNTGLPDEAVGAIAIAGRSPYTCDIAPIAICLPNDFSGEPQTLFPGQGIRLRTSRQGQQWEEGEFGFASVDIDPAGNCAGLTTETGRQACLVNIRERISSCIRPDRVDIETGQRPGQEYAAFDMSFDIYEESTIQFFNNAFYAPSPHAVRGFVPANSSSAQICAPTRRSPDTMGFPLDDCDSGPFGCSGSLYGDGDWEEGREDYVEMNYSLEDADDEDIEDGPFFDFPQSDLTRYEYYLLEIERAANGGIMVGAGLPPYTETKHFPDNDGGRGTGSPEDPLEDYTSWDDFWPDDSAPILPHEDTSSRRFDNGLPQCNTGASTFSDPGRRVLLAAGIHCPNGGAALVGNETDVEVIDYYRVFQLSLTENFSGVGSTFDLPVEVIERVDPRTLNSYRDVVQLYR